MQELAFLHPTPRWRSGLAVEHALDAGGDGALGVGLDRRDGHHPAIGRDLLAPGGRHPSGVGGPNEGEFRGPDIEAPAGQGQTVVAFAHLNRIGAAIAREVDKGCGLALPVQGDVDPDPAPTEVFERAMDGW